MIMNVRDFLVVGVSVSAYLDLRTPLVPRGLWIGFVFELAAVAMFLLVRVRTRLRRVTAHTLVNEPSLTASC